jgi:predicted SprT family Zn-dependent metalloprotease
MENLIKEFRQYLQSELRFAQRYENAGSAYHEGQVDILISIINELEHLLEEKENEE